MSDATGSEADVISDSDTQYDDGLAAIAESMGEGGLYSQVLKGESDADDASDANYSTGVDEGAGQEQEQEQEESGADDNKQDNHSRKPWDIDVDRPEILDSDEFKSVLEASGKTEEELLQDLVSAIPHKMVVRGKERVVSYDKIVAEAQIASASRQKSQRMNEHIKNGMLIDTINAGGEEGMLALKHLLSSAKDSFKADDIEGLLSDVLDLEGTYDSSMDLSKAEEAQEFDRYMSDVIDTPEYNSNIKQVTNDVEGWLPKELADEVRNDYKSLREYYDIVSSHHYPEIRQHMDDTLDSLPAERSREIRSNANLFHEFFNDTVNRYAQYVNGDQPNVQDTARVQEKSGVVGNSKTVRPPRNTSGKRVKSAGTNPDNIDFLSMSREELNGMLSNYR